MANTDKSYSSTDQPDPKPGPFMAKVVSNIDPTYMGVLEVEILRPVGSTDSEGQLHQVKYMSPFWGQTSVIYNSQNNNYDGTQKSYGMWMVPPDVGAIVMIVFIDGDPRRGYWMGCIPDENMDFMVPGLAATAYNVEGGLDTPLGDHADRVPVAEYNKTLDENNTARNSTTINKPLHPFAQRLADQGLLMDDIRGTTTSSARREAPSMVFGISTPGPLDKQSNSPIGNYGKREHVVTGAPISRLGGTTFVMDDGDDKFLRRTAPTDGPPDYANVLEGGAGGDVTMPHNELFRIRTRTGHQILFHNSEDLIYITNSRGTAWIELTSDGKIDIYAQDSISVRTQNDLNFYADRDINMEAGRNINLKATDAAGLGDTTAAGRIQIEAVGDFIRIVNGNVFTQTDGTRDDTIAGVVTQSFESKWDVTTGDAVNITTGGDLNLKVSGASVVSSSGDFTISAANTAIDGGNINFNSGIAGPAGTATAATPPNPLPTIDNPTEVDGKTLTSILPRIPTTEPYPHHENLDATMFKPDATNREAATAIAVPPAWKTYSTDMDTFSRPAPLDPASEV
jgi:hypothetical protein